MEVHLQREIDNLKKKILGLGGEVEELLRDAVKALRTRDDVLAASVVARDPRIDQIEVDVEEECLKILALHQPVALDLRFVVAVLKINNDLERVGDLAVNIAERARFLAGEPSVAIPDELSRMQSGAQAMLKEAIDALVNRDLEIARGVLRRDDEIDGLNRAMYSLMAGAIRSEPDRIDAFISLLSVSRQLERVADQATNIAEDVIYMVGGEIVRHQGGRTGLPVGH
ncbi:MAG: phosphate signaling complex protein PhoU [Calditrichaeota bacterium]|nr:phosphate signaling complex protein PhoU [Calditrichota bacterium]